MHKYLKAAGFSEYDTEGMVYRLIRNMVERPEYLSARLDLGDGSQLLEYRMPINTYIGICAAIVQNGTEFSEIQYYYPYFDTFELSTESPCIVERHTAAETFSGIIDEYNLGLSLIFYITNPIGYRLRPDMYNVTEFRGTSLSAFAERATVLLPVMNNEDLFSGIVEFQDEQLIQAARNGDPKAIETLTASDIDMYNQISERIENEDLYSLVEQSFMPCGVECDQYSIIGQIIDVAEEHNQLTNEELRLLKISSNDVEFWMCIRKKDLLGEPQKGRRIKCKLWMQGRVNFDY